MFKENLMSALKKAVDYHNGGLSDDASVVKSAGEYEFNPEQTQRLVETYNTAKTICFYKTAEDRSAPFALASAGTVLQDLFKGAQHKKSADPVMLRDYSCYDMPMHIMEVGETGSPDEILAKAASAEPEARIDNYSAEELFKKADDYRRLAEDARISAETAHEEYLACAHGLAVDMAKTADAHEGLACLRSWPVADMSQSVAQDVERWFDAETKKAAGKITFTAFDIENPELMERFGVLCQLGLKQAECAAVSHMFFTMAGETYDTVKRAALGLSREEPESFFSGRVLGLMRDGSVVKYAQDQGRKGGGGGGIGLTDPVKLISQSLGAGAGGAIKDVATKAMGDALGSDAASKALTDRAKNLHRKFILERLVTTDPILRGLPEEDVISAYQTLVQLAPDVSLNEDVARSILRSATTTSTSAIAPYDAKTFVDLDAAIKAQLEQQGGKKKQVTA